ncbi:MAG TPA: phage terminase small subunit P27 family [Alphaproteobacteria bacterium]|nr:phage terminase small subunit P27 family [Alphaproteobacteria bacterium]
MGKRGPKRTLTHILEQRGSPRAKDRAKNEPKPKLGMPKPPEFLQGKALEEWYRKAQLLYDQGTLTLIDDTALGAYCLAYGLMCEALEICQNQETGKMKLIQETVNGNFVQYPALGIYRTALRDMVKFAAEFGMTPTGRTGINVPQQQTEKQTSAQKWLAKQTGA